MRIPKFGKGLLTLAALSLTALLLLACTAPETPPTAILDTQAAAAAEAENMAAGGTMAARTAAGQPAAAAGISTTGRGSASAPPDLADLSLGVEAFAGSVKDARTAAAEAMTAMLAALKANGVAEKDIRTDYFDIRPQYTGREITRCPAGDTDSAAAAAVSGREGGGPEPADGCYQEWQQVLTGYLVSNTVNVKVRDLESLSPVIDAATAAGGDLTRFNRLSFAIEDTAALQEQARAAAVADLQERAGQLAEFGGVALGELIYIAETGFAPPERADLSKTALAMESADAAAGRSTPIAAGQLSVEVTVQGTFAIR